MQADKRESTAQYSETNHKRSPLTLSERQTALLISAGLVKGTTLLFGRRLLSLGIPAGALYAPDGNIVAVQKAGYLF